MSRLSNVLGIDDGPFERHSERPVLVVGPVFSGPRLDGLLTAHIQRDGLDATDRLIRMVQDSRFSDHVQLIMVGGITVGGFNVIDLRRLSKETKKPVLAITRRQPDLDAVREALVHVPQGAARWELIEKQGPMEPLGELFVHRVGVGVESAREAIVQSTLHGSLPEPLRIAHILAGGFVTGHSKGAA